MTRPLPRHGARHQRQDVTRRSGSCPALLMRLLSQRNGAQQAGRQSTTLADWEVRTLLGTNLAEHVTPLARSRFENLEREVPSANLPCRAPGRSSTDPQWYRPAAETPKLIMTGPSQSFTACVSASSSSLQAWRGWEPVKTNHRTPQEASMPLLQQATLPHPSGSQENLLVQQAQTMSLAATRLKPKRRPLVSWMQSSTSPSHATACSRDIAEESTQVQLGARQQSIPRCIETDLVVPPEQPPARVAVVGAGPVGLWIAVLLARVHARLLLTSSGVKIERPPTAPIIDVREQRTDDSGWGSRRVVLAMSNLSQDLLNNHMLTERETCARNTFAPACSINFIESKLREEFDKYVAAGFGTLKLGQTIHEPESLLADHDVVFVASGRRWPGDDWRQDRGLQVNVGKTEEALILKFTLEPGPNVGRTLSEVRGALGRFEAPGHPTYILRPGATEEQGYLWVLGLAPELLDRARSALEDFKHEQDLLQEMQSGRPANGCKLEASAAAEQQSLTSKNEFGPGIFGSFRGMWASLTSTSIPSSPTAEPSSPKKGNKQQVGNLKAALAYVDKQMKPLEVSPRITVASYWHSEEVVHRIQKPDGSVGWIVLVGDAACGKPFYLGSNLNGHFHDAMALVAAPWTRWASAASEAAEHKSEPGLRREQLPEGSVPFKRYLEQYKRRTDGIGFRCQGPSSPTRKQARS
eukprot:TRINITY_DN5642_c0_g1_i1.p1 TRINITY_DN5642_c0_g1~~TRINITY_DN5642_c0_g1_i1.p1  ORF type:complete len:696 (-),score=80.27 TRINITY_DN5642_c0_g1_i1:80-2167(-)